MIIHFSVLGVILFASFVWERTSKVNKIKSNDYIIAALPFVLIFGYLAFLAAMRSGLNDTSTYIETYDYFIPGTFDGIKSVILSDGKDKGFYVLSNVIKMIFGSNYHWWFAFFAVIESLVFVYIFRRESVGILVSCYYIFASALYTNYFSMMRQWFAISLFLFAFKYLKNKKFWIYLVIILVAAQFHNSAYFCIPIYFFAHLKPWSNKQLALVVAFCIAILFMNPVLSSLESSDSTYSYVYETMATSTGSSHVRIIIAAVPVVLCFIYRKKIESLHNKTLVISINMSMLNLLLTIVATFTSGLYIIRMSTYFNIFNAILFSWLLEQVITGKNKKIIKLCFYAFYFAFYLYQMNYQGEFYYVSDVIGNYY